MERFLDSQGESYGRKRLGRGGGGGGGSAEGVFHERAGGPWGMEQEINRIVAIRNGGFNRTAMQENYWCDHTSTNASDPIRTQ